MVLGSMARLTAWPIHEENHLVPECAQRLGKPERIVIRVTEETDSHRGFLSYVTLGSTEACIQHASHCTKNIGNLQLTRCVLPL